ncbi:hypothetical protein LZ30DRAFT_777440 [Colletotrichum cereale]|nr:hypothetical protein LZ30DRAFT_777440 [Colletotrichum cereale]
MYMGHNARSKPPSAAPSTISSLPEATQPRSAGPSAYNSPTVAVAIVVALLLLLAVTAIACTENRKQKVSNALRSSMDGKTSDDFGQPETRGSLGSLNSTAELKKPEPVERGPYIGKRFAILYGSK